MSEMVPIFSSKEICEAHRDGTKATSWLILCRKKFIFFHRVKHGRLKKRRGFFRWSQLQASKLLKALLGKMGFPYSASLKNEASQDVVLSGIGLLDGHNTIFQGEISRVFLRTERRSRPCLELITNEKLNLTQQKQFQ